MPVLSNLHDNVMGKVASFFLSKSSFVFNQWDTTPLKAKVSFQRNNPKLSVAFLSTFIS